MPEPICDCFSFTCDEGAPPQPASSPAEDIVFVKSFASKDGIAMVITDFPFTYMGMHFAQRENGRYGCSLGNLYASWRWVRCVHGRVHLVNWFPDGADGAFKVNPGEVKVFEWAKKEVLLEEELMHAGDGIARPTGKTRLKMHWTEKITRRLRALTPGRYFVILSIGKDDCDWTVFEAGKVER